MRQARTRSVGALLLLAAGLLVAGAGEAAAPARPVRGGLKLEDLGTPIQRRKLGTSILYRDPATKHIHLFLTLTGANELGGDPPYQILDFGLEDGTVRTAMGCEGSGGRAWLHSNGKLYITQGRPPAIVEYDPATGKARLCGQLTNNYFHAVQCIDEGPDGALYCGLYGRHACRYDPKTGKIDDFGGMDGEADSYVYTIGSDGKYVYGGIAHHGQWYLAAYSIEAKTQENFFKPKAGEKSTSGGDVARYTDGNLYYNTMRLRDGKPHEQERPPAGAKPARNGGVWAFHEAEKELNLDLDLDDINPNNWNNGTVTVKWRRKGDPNWRSASFKGIELTPNPPYRMVATPEGKLLGFGNWYGPVFLLDPETNKTEYIGVPPGSLYDMLFVGDKLYMCGYSAFFAVYDRKRPYTLTPKNQYDFSKDMNPARFPSVKWALDLALGADGRIYTAGNHGRHMDGSDILIFDPATEKQESLRKELSLEKYSVRNMVAMDKGRLIVASIKALAAEEQGFLAVYDTQAKKLTKQIKAAIEAPHPGYIMACGPNDVMGLVKLDRKDDQGKDIKEFLVYRIGLATEKVAYQNKAPGNAFNGPTEWDFKGPDSRFCVGPDGCGWLFIDRWLTRIRPQDGRVEKLLELKQGARLLFLGDDLYLYGGGRQFFGGFSQVLRIRKVFAQ
jgi:hypothetical protein